MIKKYKFNIYDILIIAMVALCVMGIMFRENISDSISKTVYNDTANIQFQVKEADGDIISSVSAGDVFYFENGAEFGTLLEGYSYKNSTVYENVQGTPEMTSSPEKYDITGSFLSNGRFTDNGFLCGTEKIFINSEIKLHSKNALLIIKVTAIETAINGNNEQ